VKSKKTSIILACLLAAACGPAQNDPGPGGVTVGEARALDEAAEMLDERNAPATGFDDGNSIKADTQDN